MPDPVTPDEVTPELPFAPAGVLGQFDGCWLYKGAVIADVDEDLWQLNEHGRWVFDLAVQSDLQRTGVELHWLMKHHGPVTLVSAGDAAG